MPPARSTTRQASLALCRSLKLPVNPALPELEQFGVVRTSESIVRRALALCAAVACAYGFPKDRIRTWLTDESLIEELTRSESAFLLRNEGSPQPFQAQVYGLWAFAWALNLLPTLEWSKGPPDDLVYLYPDLKSGQSADTFRRRVAMRRIDELVPRLDEVYCIHWGCRQQRLTGQRSELAEGDVAEFRRALEWVVSNELWDEVPLDT